ncbi:MAG: T9SS type A sorting domain-containing protein [Bacteroidales bacterium]|nr:T9SS type A sorting domain-containing protein [Bacteroidales bacterium]
MKKILLSLFAVCFLLSANTQSFVLSYEGNTLAPDAVLVVADDPTVEVIEAWVNITNNAATAKSVLVKKVIHDGDTLAGSDNTFCWGLCYPNTTYVSPFPQTIQPGDTSDLFYGDYRPNNLIGISKITYVFWDEMNVNDSVAVNVHYKASPASVNDLAAKITASGVYPNPASGMAYIDYSIPNSGGNNRLVITNMLGAKIKEIGLKNISGKATLDVSELMNGIYFYSIISDNQQVITGKFLVRH